MVAWYSYSEYVWLHSLAGEFATLLICMEQKECGLTPLGACDNKETKVNQVTVAKPERKVIGLALF